MNITLSMPKKFIERLRSYSDKTDMGYSEIVRRALDVYFKEEGHGSETIRE